MSNRLASETSPYLQQHANNPVDWYPWGAEALARAQQSGKPILLSIGYSACHWCHVMAHESFEDADVARTMNELYVNIKVDREERPDLDQIYQSAHHMLTQRNGGWPLTMFLTPDGSPFFGGTYFPKAPRYGLPGFEGLLRRVEQVYREKRSEIEQQNQSMRAALARSVPAGAVHHSELTEAPVATLVRALDGHFDDPFGGFGGAPKFPHPTDLALLLRRHMASGEARLREMVLTTLTRMAEGGIYDHLGGGFCRYSVDERWNIPHFEKMLYDNGPLLRLYAEAAVLTGEPLYRRVAEQTAAWITREMQSPEGGFYSSLDADSEGEEGKFYVWQPAEVRELLNDAEHAVVVAHYGLDRAANFENHAWHFHVATELRVVADELEIDLEGCERLLESARAKLLARREQRVHPGRDEKILTSWNALMIEGLARAGSLLGKPEWIEAARRALEFIRTTLWKRDRLLATYKDGRAHLNAYLDDYAFLMQALLELMQADFRVEDLEWAEELADVLLEQFEDREGGGFFFTSHDHEQLIARTKPGHDNATPSGNAVAAFALQRLGHLTGETRYLDAAERCIALFYTQMSEQPGGFGMLAAALDEYAKPVTTVVLRGPTQETLEWQRGILSRLRPDTLVLPLADVTGHLPPTLDRPVTESVNAWVCTGVVCMPPVTDRVELERICNTRGLG